MELKETIELMQSSDYKDRFKAEYYQTRIRFEKLTSMLDKYNLGTLSFEPTCPIDLLEEQRKYMLRYLHCLEIRANIEGIKLQEASHGK